MRFTHIRLLTAVVLLVSTAPGVVARGFSCAGPAGLKPGATYCPERRAQLQLRGHNEMQDATSERASTPIQRAATATSQASTAYRAERAGEVVRLEDARTQTVVSIIPSAGNKAFEMKVKGQNVLYFPYQSVDEFKSKGAGGFNGIPFLGPWANRLDEQAFYANGQRYAFDMQLGNVRGAIPIHGLVTTTNQWQVTDVQSDGTSAWMTSRLDFYRNPAWMKQFPFAHTIDMTYRLQDGILQVTTKIANLSTDPMPVAIGFHPYFQLTDSKREDWTVSVGAKVQWLLAPNKVPTGETEPIEKLFPDPRAIALKDFDLDHVFGDLVRDADGRAVMTVKGKAQKLDVLLGPNYRSVVIYAPKPAPPSAPGAPPAAAGGRLNAGAQDRNYICFEPMAGITDAMNLAQRGLYKELQSIPPGGTWQESFWVRPSGF
ncbi:MAG: aldose 1-epimerase [Acidobacteriota bacterium]|jgi:aldose 1-epimerase